MNVHFEILKIALLLVPDHILDKSFITSESHSMWPTIIKGGIGALASIGSFIISSQTQIHEWLKIFSLVIGISIGLITIISSALDLIKKLKKK